RATLDPGGGEQRENGTKQQQRKEEDRTSPPQRIIRSGRQIVFPKLGLPAYHSVLNPSWPMPFHQLHEPIA
ncbi:MAG: hypothetical protein ABI667_01050, partial [Sphingomicrobium sp.]